MDVQPVENSKTSAYHVLRYASDTDIEPVPMEAFAVWVAKLKPMLQ